jgi:hypothetical protein
VHPVPPRLCRIAVRGVDDIGRLSVSDRSAPLPSSRVILDVMGEPTRRTTRSPEQLLLFSDAVVAIAITLLAIDLPIPHGDTSHEFLSSVRHNGEHYIAFAISFVVIASAWTLHRKTWSFADSFDDRQVTVNMVWLFTIVLSRSQRPCSMGTAGSL